MPGYIRHDVLDENNIPYEEIVRLDDALPKLDILYMTRVQKERFFNEEDYLRMKDFYVLNAEKNEARSGRHVRPAPASARERDLNRHRRRPTRRLLHPDTVRRVHQDGAHTQAARNRSKVTADN